MSNLTENPNFFRYSLFLFNIIFLITGIIFIAEGNRIVNDFYEYSIFLEGGGYYSLPRFFIAIGCFIFFIGIYSFYVATRENYRLTLILTILLGIIFIFELSAGISGFTLKDSTPSKIELKMSETMKTYKTDYNTAQLWDRLQRDHGCCGLKKPDDWLKPLDAETTKMLPLSCCTTPIGALDLKCILMEKNENLYKTTCLNTFSNLIGSYCSTLGGVGIGLAVLQFLGLIYAVFILRLIKNKTGSVGLF